MKITCLGWYGRNNCGDESFKSALKQIFSEHNLHFTTDAPPEDGLLILGGGDVIKPAYLRKIPKDRKYYALGVGLGYESEIDLLDDRCQQILFRNWVDPALASQKGFTSYSCPDLAFAIQRPTDHRPKPGYKKRMMVILANSSINPGINVNVLPEISYQDYLKWELAKSLDDLSEWYEINFVHMSHEQYAYDLGMHYEVASRMKTQPQIWSGAVPYPENFMTWMSGFDLVVSMKFHGLIFATIMGVPFVNLGLTRKTNLYCQENKFNRLMVDPYSFTKDRFLDVVKIAEEEGVREDLLALASLNFGKWGMIAESLKSWVSQAG